MPEVGREGQERLAGASVLLIGAGGLGSPAALYLAAAGIGRLGIVDDDDVELSNLQRQVIHDTESVGTPKVESARGRLAGVNPHIRVETFRTRLRSENAPDVMAGWDFVVDGSDNFPTRYLVNDACVMLGIPFAYGAVLRFEGQASVFAAEGGPCYRCLFRDPPPPELAPNCAEAGVLGVVPGMIGSIQACEAIKWILGEGESLVGRLLLVDAFRMTFRTLTIRPDPDCVVCGNEPTLTELVDYEHFCASAGEPAGESADAGGSRSGTEDAMVAEIDVHDLRALVEAREDFQLVDVREDYEWEICNLGHLGAQLAPMDQLAELVPKLDRNKPVIVHCRTGPRGASAAAWLRLSGVDDVRNLRGGIIAWAEEFDPDMVVY